MTQLVSVSEAARLLGLDKSVVSRQVARFGLMGADKKFDIDRYRSLRDNSLNPLMARRPNASLELDEPAAAPAPAPAPAEVSHPTMPSGINKAATAHKLLQAQILRLDLEERQGKLVPKAEVDETITTASRRLRDKLLSMPARLAVELGGGPEHAAIKTAADRLIRQALDEFTTDLQERPAEEEGEGEAAVAAD